LAWKLVEGLCEDPNFYGVKVEKASAGTTIVDAGIKAKGGFNAGKTITEICMGGCGKAEITFKEYGDLMLPAISVYTDHPAVATLGSQFSGWQAKEGAYSAIGSGPARALALKPKELYEKIEYSDDFDRAVLVLETDKCPPEKLLERIAQDCRVSAENLAIILTPTNSVAGATQISGRVVETGIHKLNKLGLNPKNILYACGYAPISTIHPKFVYAMARTNDAILYGGITYYAVEYDDEERLKTLLNSAPSKASKDYGKPFIDIFKQANYDFFKIDPNLFAPAKIVINNVKTGKTFASGEINSAALAESFGFMPR